MVTIGPRTILDDRIAECGTEEEMSPTTLARRSTWIVCLSALVLDVSVLHATTVQRMTFSEVVRGAAVIAAGTVSTIDAMRDPDQERPFTEVTFEGEDLEMLKRDAGQRPLTPLTRTRVAALRQAAVVDPSATADTRQQDLEVFRDCPDCPELVVIPAGTFRMGSPASEAGRYDREGPRHEVTLRSRFALGRYEVTRGEYAAFVSATGWRSSRGCYMWDGSWNLDDEASWRAPGFAQGDGHPVVCVSWTDAQAYVRWLSEETGKGYRLPSEAEWEYAARGGTTTSRYWGDGSSAQCAHANGADASAKRVHSGWPVASCDDGVVHTASVGSYDANAFGLFDVLGNVWEWTEDCWHGTYAGAPGDGAAWTRS